MDEPFSNLDRGLRDQMRRGTLAVLRRLGTRVIMVTHDPEEALSSGGRIMLMRSGAMVQSGTGHDLYRDPVDAYAAEFFGTVNKLSGLCRNGMLQTPLGPVAAPGHADGTRATAFIRPRTLTIAADGDGIDGTVVSRRLMGEIEETALAIAQSSQTLIVRSTGRHGVAPGSAAKLTLREPTLVF